MLKILVKLSCLQKKVLSKKATILIVEDYEFLQSKPISQLTREVS